MSDRVYFRPRAGVRMPIHPTDDPREVPAAGCWLRLTRWIKRRIADGGGEIVDPAPIPDPDAPVAAAPMPDDSGPATPEPVEEH